MCAWIFFYPNETKISAVVCSLVYSFIESAFTFFERGKSYTSAAQFGANLLYIPVLLDWYAWFFYPFPAAYVLLFPLNIWILEIVEEWLIIRVVFGRNVAWTYKDYSDEYLNGCIRLGHAFGWWSLGLGCSIVYPTITEMSSHAASLF